MAANLQDIAERLSGLTVMEAAELAKRLEEKWGVSAQQATIAMPTMVPEQAPEVEQTEFSVMLTDVGPTKIHVIKEIRVATGLDLKSAMALANPDELPKLVKANLTRTAADEIKAKIEGVGGVVSIE